MNRIALILSHVSSQSEEKSNNLKTFCTSSFHKNNDEPDWSAGPKEKFSEKLFRLDGRVVVITGGARGIGREIARAYASVGANVMIFDILKDEVTKSAREIEAETGSKVSCCYGDASNLRDVENAITQTVSKFGSIDIVVTSAAIAPENTELIDLEEYNRVMDVNVNGTLYFITKALPYLKKSSYGRIITFTSSVTIQTAPNMLGYSVSKGTISALTRTLAAKLGKFGITVNSLMPGWTYTKMAYDVVDGDFKGADGDQPLGRIGKVQDLAGAAVFLASDLACFVTGHELKVNGGFGV